MTLPRQSGGGGKSSQEVVDELANDILSKLPADYDIEKVQVIYNSQHTMLNAMHLYQVMELYPVVYEESMNTVLRQELIRFNRLTKVVRSTLQNMRKALKVSHHHVHTCGMIVMELGGSEDYNLTEMTTQSHNCHLISHTFD